MEASLSIPAGALGDDEQITIQVFNSDDLPPPPPGEDLLTRAFNFGPQGLTFTEPVTIVFTYTDDEVSGLDENSLTILLLVGGDWEAVPDCSNASLPDPSPCVASRDLADNSITVVTNHFSTFGIAGPPSGPTCNGRQATIVGTERHNLIFGTRGDDVIVALGGNDLIFGSRGNDVICAGDGRDTVFGGPGNDDLFGEEGNDNLFGEGGNDHLYGGPGNDDLFGGPGNDDLFGEEGNDDLFGDGGDDHLYGGPGRDSLFGDSGNDVLDGGDDRDFCDGGRGTNSTTNCERCGWWPWRCTH